MNMSKNICKPQVEDLLSIQTSWNALVLLLASTKNICLTSSPPQGPLLHSQFSLNGWSEIILVSKVEALKRWNHIFLQLINFYRNYRQYDGSWINHLPLLSTSEQKSCLLRSSVHRKWLFGGSELNKISVLLLWMIFFFGEVHLWIPERLMKLDFPSKIFDT